jgi:hypothetical protein
MASYKINGNLFTNQTGRFPVTSNRGHAYVVGSTYLMPTQFAWFPSRIA